MNIYIKTRRGIVNQDGDLVGKPDDNSQTKARPCGTFRGSPVMGFWKAIKKGIIIPKPGKPVAQACGCCQRFPMILTFGVKNEQ